MPYYRFESITQHEAEALLASAQAALYLADQGEILLLSEDNLEAARHLLAMSPIPNRSLRQMPGLDIWSKVAETGSLRVAAFVERVEKSMPRNEHEPYLVKMPVSMPAGEIPVKASTMLPITEKSETKEYIYQDFEGNVWSYWDRYDDTDGQYTWAIRSCDSLSGNYIVLMLQEADHPERLWAAPILTQRASVSTCTRRSALMLNLIGRDIFSSP
jgi:hypothetical protein